MDSHFKVYPNPASGKITIAISNRNIAVSEVHIYSITGQLVFDKMDIQDNHTVVDLSEHDSGIYLIKVTTGNDQQTQQIVLK